MKPLAALLGAAAFVACGTAISPAALASRPPEAAAAPTVVLTKVADADRPVDGAWRAGDDTLFIVQQSGQIRPLRDGILGDAVLDIAGQINSNGERGLLGLAFSADGTLGYVHYTDGDGNTVVAEYPVDATGAFGTERRLFTAEQPFGNHNGGDVVVGPDQMVYIGLGDGGSAADPQRLALRMDSYMGKLLRIDPRPSADRPYTVPVDNPFIGTAGAHPEIWSIGLRNPWRFSFDRTTGDLWIADVGQGQWEEINVSRAIAGSGAGKAINYGWSAFEGTHRFNDDQPTDNAVAPVYEYQHGDRGCSISGGVVARDPRLPALDGWYVYSDYCSGQVRGLRVTDAAVTGDIELAGAGQVAAVVDGPDGAVYVLSHSSGIHRLDPAG